MAAVSALALALPAAAFAAPKVGVTLTVPGDNPAMTISQLDKAIALHMTVVRVDLDGASSSPTRAGTIRPAHPRRDRPGLRRGGQAPPADRPDHGQHAVLGLERADQPHQGLQDGRRSHRRQRLAADQPAPTSPTSPRSSPGATPRSSRRSRSGTSPTRPTRTTSPARQAAALRGAAARRLSGDQGRGARASRCSRGRSSAPTARSSSCSTGGDQGLLRRAVGPLLRPRARPTCATSTRSSSPTATTSRCGSAEFGWSSCAPQRLQAGQVCVNRQVEGQNLVDVIRALQHVSYVKEIYIYAMSDTAQYSLGLLGHNGRPKPAFTAVAGAAGVQALAEAPPHAAAPAPLARRRRSPTAPARPATSSCSRSTRAARCATRRRSGSTAATSSCCRLPADLGTHGLRVRLYQQWQGIGPRRDQAHLASRAAQVTRDAVTSAGPSSCAP